MARIQQKKAGKRVKHLVDSREIGKLVQSWEERKGYARDNPFNRHPGKNSERKKR